mgnify:CR=1 FL=1
MKKYILTPIFAALVSTLFVGCKDKAESEQLVSTKNMIKNIAFKDLAGKNINMVYTGEGFKFEGEGEKSTLLVFDDVLNKCRIVIVAGRIRLR